MNLLLDTHVWVWALVEPHRIATRLADELERADNALWLSPVSVWETLLLAQRGRIDVAGTPEAWVRNALAIGAVREASLTMDIAIASRTLSIPAEDPADRFIVATAFVNEFTLVTADRALASVPGVDVLAP